MIRIRLAALLASAFALSAPLLRAAGPRVASGASPRASEEAQIEQLERDRQDAFVRGDVDVLDRETAADYTTINGTGKLSTKPQMMLNLRQGKTKVLSVQLNDLKARVYG